MTFVNATSGQPVVDRAMLVSMVSASDPDPNCPTTADDESDSTEASEDPPAEEDGDEKPKRKRPRFAGI